MQVTPWSNALALAPFVLGIAACTGGTLSGKLDAGAPDAGQAEDSGFPIADAGFADTGVDRVDSGIEADAGETPDAGFPDAGETPDGGQTACTYPAGAVEPMAFGEVLTAYSWPTALLYGGQQIDLSLTDAFCATDTDIDWNQWDTILFVSIPAY